MRLAYHFQDQKVKVQGERPINADTHPADIFQSELTAYRWLLLFGVFLSHLRINLHQTHTQYSNEGTKHCNCA